jgi:hypothetical protein
VRIPSTKQTRCLQRWSVAVLFLDGITTCCLPLCVIGTVLLELLDHAVEIGITGAKAPGEPVPTALGNPLAVSDDLELTGLARHRDSINVEALLDEGHETRDLGLVVLSCRAVNDLDLHSILLIYFV